MAEAVYWIDGQAHQFGVVEKICPSIHITQNQWNDSWNLMYFGVDAGRHYSYISDYECVFNHPVNDYNIVQDYGPQLWQNLQEAKQRGTNVPLVNLAHFTSPVSAGEIISNGGFVGGMKKINEDEDGGAIEAQLSWWSPKFPVEVKNQVSHTLRAAIEPFFGYLDNIDVLQNQFASSNAFTPNPLRYGSSYFRYSIGKLCQCYENYREIDEENGKIQFKILGTYLYKQEIMHAVLVCSDTDEQFEDYPDVPVPFDGNNEAVVTHDDDGNWVWRPQATATEIVRLRAHWQPFPRYRRWENVAFAFHTPKGVFNLPNLREELYEL